MVYTILAIGDTHFTEKNVREADMLISKIKDTIIERKPDLVVLLGDLLDTFERLHTMALNKVYELVKTVKQLARTIILVGNHDYTCFAKDTQILMWNGTSKPCQSIRKGDIVVGDDNQPRKVVNIVSGKSELYRVTQSNGVSYDVTPDHILCLKCKSHRKITWNDMGKYYKVKWYDIGTNTVSTRKFHLQDGSVTRSREVTHHIAQMFLDHVTTTLSDVIEITVKNFYSKLSCSITSKLYGYKVSITDPSSYTCSEISVTKLDQVRDYYGIELEYGHRFLLADRTVVHNCNQQFLSENHWMNGMKEWENVTVVDKVIVEKLRGEKFVFVPYVFPGRFVEALNTATDTWSDASCIFCHHEFFGSKMGAITSIDGDKWSEKDCQVVSGHVHRRQKPQKNIYYTGSSIQVAFGENEDKTIALLTFDRKKCSITEIPLGLPRKKIVHLDVEDIESYVPPVDSQDSIKITVTGNHDQFKALKKTKKYKELINSKIKIAFKPQAISTMQQELGTSGASTVLDHISDNRVVFDDILSNLVSTKRDAYLLQAYEHVVNNRYIDENTIIFTQE